MKLILDTHCHTTASGHAYSTIKECMGSAADKGLELLAITDHGPAMPGAPSTFHFTNLICLPQYIHGVELLRGIELSILNTDGTVDFEDHLLSRLEIVIASIHTPLLSPSTVEEHTEMLIKVMNNPNIDIIGHLGDPKYPFDVERVINAAVKTGTIIELNNSSFNPFSVRVGCDEYVKNLARCCKDKSALMVLGSDAHFCADVGNFCYLEPLIAELEIPEELILNTSIEKLKSAIK